jgi:RNA polymerase sigma-70 factor (ECF subfamily)
MTDWSQIVAEHQQMVWKTVYRLVRNEADAADSFQRTFVSALELSRVETIRNWSGLLKRLATIKALECLRQRRREAGHLLRFRESSNSPREIGQPIEAAAANELAEHLRSALAEIDLRQAQAFCLSCLEGVSYEEIAIQFGITVNHVGVLLNRAKASLRQRLQAHRPAAVDSKPKAEV